MVWVLAAEIHAAVSDEQWELLQVDLAMFRSVDAFV